MFTGWSKYKDVWVHPGSDLGKCLSDRGLKQDERAAKADLLYQEAKVRETLCLKQGERIMKSRGYL